MRITNNDQKKKKKDPVRFRVVTTPVTPRPGGGHHLEIIFPHTLADIYVALNEVLLRVAWQHCLGGFQPNAIST